LIKKAVYSTYSPNAISILGLAPLSDLVLSTIIKNRFDTLFEGGKTLLEFWIRSVRCGVLACEISRHLNETGQTSPVFICGLLLNIGHLVIAAAIPHQAREAAELSASDALSIDGAETSILGFNRYDVGLELARRWNFPALILDCMQDVTEPKPNSSIPVQIVDAAHQLSMLDSDDADLLIETFPSGFKIGDYPLTIDEFAETVSPKVEEHFDEIFFLFYA